MVDKFFRVKHALCGMIIGLTILVTSGVFITAQAKQQAVATFKDWSVFEGTIDNKKICYIATTPEKSEASKANVRRGDIYLMIAIRPADKVMNEVSYMAGYPLKERSTVSAVVDSKEYKLFTQGEGAWMPSAKEDQQIVASMQKGTSAVLKGISSRGTRTTDTFSLIGFTNAIKDAKKRCA